jgi:ribosome-binding protein aMBF1 (putative translation factor)
MPEHQDWDTRILKPTIPFQTKKKQFVKKLTEEEEEIKIIASTKGNRDMSMALMDARVKKGYSQKQLANLINVRVQTISDYESGKETPKGDKLSKLRRILKF